MSKRTQIFEFKKGQKFQLDTIYSIQGITDKNNEDWFEFENNDWGTDNVIVTKNIKITIIVE
jgi:hypothetical protein